MKDKFILVILISFFSSTLCNFLFWLPFEKKVYDFKYLILLPSKKNEEIVIVDIDEKSLEKLGRYQNWPRAYFAEVIDYLIKAKVVGIDIFFGEPDTLPIVARRYYTKPNFDSILASAIKKQGRVVMVSSLGKESIFRDIARTGLGEIVADADGVVRNCYPLIEGKETFAIQIANFYNNALKKGRFLAYYSKDAFRKISFSEVYFQKVPKEYFNDKIVLIGGTASGLFDYHAIPFSRHFPGIEIQANFVNCLVNNLKITEFPWVGSMLMVFIITILLSFFTLTKSARFYIIFYILIFFGYFLLSLLLFYFHIEMGVIKGYYGFILTIVISLVYRYQFEEREKRHIKSVFARYYSKELVEKVIKEPPKLGGEKVFCTIIFADIRNFTQYTEKSKPEDVTRELNRFLTEMVITIFKYQGRIDKFIGDCVMAVFGYPVKLKNSALNACLCAQEMVQKSSHLGFQLGVGINSGEVISGNFGSPMRMEYTVIGDAVNLASRLEGLTKEFGVNIVVGEATYKLVVSHPTIELNFRELGKARVKGKEEEITVYELSV
uniref:Adenylate/guanylate cyclase domain-containing protein n=1 Tax=candidate division WOR-3 bacterium TaxID=2052148 RepID=A0A7C4X9G0_UNCW3